MGNQLTNDFAISEDNIMSGGPSGMWKIYDATKKSNGVQMSVFVIEKNRFDREPKNLREEIFSAVRKEVKTLTKLRHPAILHILEPLTEDGKIMYFGTEPVQGSLKFLIDDANKRNIIPSEIELKALFLELIGTVNFLHNNAHLVHLAISPENIYLTADGKFKLAGFFFSQSVTGPDATVPPGIDYSLVSPTAALVPHPAFTAPEVIRDNVCSAASDAFSVGCTIYNLLQVANNGKSSYFFDLGDKANKSAYLDETRKFRGEYAATRLQNFTSGASNLLTRLLVPAAGDRFKLNDAHTHVWFNDPRIKTLEYLEHLNEKEHQHKLQFLDGLVRVLGEFDAKIILRRILPRLASYLVVDKLSSAVLGPIIAILEKDKLCAKPDFYAAVWPHLDVLCKGREISAQGLYIIISHTEVWLKLIEMQDFQETMLVLYQKAIDCGISKIQEHTVGVIPTFAKRMEYATLKATLIPRILRLALSTSIGTLRLKCLESLASMVTILDATVIKNALMPSLGQLCTMDTDGKLQLVMVRIIESALKHFKYSVISRL